MAPKLKKKKKPLSELERCLNCGVSCIGIIHEDVLNLSIKDLQILALWTEQQMPLQGKICKKCVQVVQDCELGADRVLGHNMVCIGCSKSMLRNVRKKEYHNEDHLALVFPWFKIHKNRYLCYNCETRMKRILKKNNEEASKLEEPEAIDAEEENDSESETKVPAVEQNRLVLPLFRRVITNRKYCIFKNCKNPITVIPRLKRKYIFQHHGMLINRRGKVCQSHLKASNWSFRAINTSHHFSTNNVEEMLSIAQNPISITDFDRINDMSEHICKYWTGLGLEEFKQLYEQLKFDRNQCNSLRNALAIYLSKKITGDTISRYADVFLIGVVTLVRQLDMVDKCLEKINYKASS